jgi:hypothetical protein
MAGFMSMSLASQVLLKGLLYHGAAMQVFYNKRPGVIPQESSAVIVSLQVNPQEVHFMLTKDSYSDFLTYGIALNSFSVGNDGCFHIRDAILVLTVVINKRFIPCNNVLQKLISMIGIMCEMHESSSI